MDFDEKKLESAGVVSAELKRCCSDCRTTKTPLWRGGPGGPKSLCNACGIRYRKKRRALLGLTKREKENKEEDERRENNKGGVSWPLRFLGKDVGLGEALMHMQRKRKLAEEEEAAMLLMDLSCGFEPTA